MDILYYTSGILALILMVAVPIGIIKPNLYKRLLKSKATRKSISLIGVSSLLFVGLVAGVTEPASLKQSRIDKERASKEASLIEEQNRLKEAESQPKIEEKEVTEELSVAFTKEQKEDSGLAKGETKIAQAGVEGKKTLTYKVKYENGKELSRELLGEVVIAQPVAEVTSVGTYVYVAPKPAPKPNTSAPSTQAPSTPSGGRTGAICKDGSRSNATGRGACSHHGGVSRWLY